MESRYVYLSSNNQVLSIARWSLTRLDNYLPVQKKRGSVNTYYTKTMNNASVNVLQICEKQEEKQRVSLGAPKMSIQSVEKLDFLTWQPSGKQLYLFLVTRWDHLHLEIKRPINFREFDHSSLGCRQGLRNPIKTGLFAKGQILDHLSHDL